MISGANSALKALAVGAAVTTPSTATAGLTAMGLLQTDRGASVPPGILNDVFM